jgi:HEAT repeat protein
VKSGENNERANSAQANGAALCVNCESAERLLIYYACDEAKPEERAAVEQHVGECANCAAMLAVELRLQQMLATMPQTTDELDLAGELLAQCRSELAEALDDSRDHAALGLQSQGFLARCFAWCRMEMAVHPAMGAAFFVLMGLAVGRVMPTASNGMQQAGLIPTSIVNASPRISEQELQNMNVSGIYLVPDGAAGGQSVEVHLRSMQPIVVSGGADDEDVKRVLSFVMTNSQRYDSDVRMDSVDVLRSSAGDADVRRLLCATSLHDANVGVRLRALAALHGFEQDDTVRETLMDALMHDTNPGVRIEAMNELRATVEAGKATADPRIAQVLRDLSEHDSNNYIRLQAAAAIRNLGPQQ